MRVVDCHAHAFPDAIAKRAMEHLADASHGWKAWHDGTVAGLTASMDEASIDSAVVASIATKPTQVRPILDWSRSIASGRIFPFVSLHPDFPENEAVLDEAVAAGIRGVKIHNLYQGFAIDEARMIPLYGAVAERGLALLFHGGFDPAYDDCDGASPRRIRNVHLHVPDLKIVAGHFGGWRVWEQVDGTLAGEDVYLELSFTLGQIDERHWDLIFDRHPKDRILFGTDSPWAGQKEYLALFRSLGLGEELERRILEENALRLLGLQP